MNVVKNIVVVVILVALLLFIGYGVSIVGEAAMGFNSDSVVSRFSRVLPASIKHLNVLLSLWEIVLPNPFPAPNMIPAWSFIF